MLQPLDTLESRERDEFFMQAGEAIRKTGRLKVMARQIADCTKSRERHVRKLKGKRLADMLRLAWGKMGTYERAGLVAHRTLDVLHDQVMSFYDQMGVDFEEDDDGVWLNVESPPANPPAEEAFRDAMGIAFKGCSPWERCIMLWHVAEAGFEAWRDHARAMIEELLGSSEQQGALADSAEQMNDAEGDRGDEKPGSRGFTHLDHLIIDQVLETIMDQPGCMTPAQLDDLINELAFMNKDRCMSWFHLGFKSSMFRHDFDEKTGLDNDERRAWWLAGWFNGQVRKHDVPDALDELMSLNKQDWNILLSSPFDVSFDVFTKLFYKEMVDSGRVKEASQWVKAVPPSFTLVVPTIKKWLAKGQYDDARALLKASDGTWSAMVDEGWKAYMHACHALLELELERRQGYFPRARKLVKEIERRGLVEDLDPASEIYGESVREIVDKMHAEKLRVLMSIAGLEILSLANPESRNHLSYQVQENAEDLEKLFMQGHEPFDLLAASVIPSMLDRESDRDSLLIARERLDRAINICSSRTGLDEFKARMRFWRSILTIRLEDETGLTAAIQHAIDSMGSRGGVPMPMDLLMDVLHDAACLSAPKLDDLVLQLLKDDEWRLPMLKNEAMVELARERRVVADWVVEDPEDHLHGLDTRERLGLVEASLSTATNQEHALDEMVTLGKTREEVASEVYDIFTKSRPDRFSWSDDEILFIKCDLLESDDRRHDAVELIKKRVHQAITKQDPDAETWVELFEAFGAPSEEVQALERRLQPRQDIQVEDGKSRLVRVLCVGGNEQQKKIQARISQHVNQEMEDKGVKVEVDFEHPGWGSNWNRGLQKLDSRIQDVHIVVTLRFMRTMYGRELRRKINKHGKQWRASHGHAQESIARSICRAVQDAILAGNCDESREEMFT